MKAAEVRLSLALLLSLTLIVLALWCWRSAGTLAIDATRPDVARWAVRSAAVAAAAIAQIVILTAVAHRVYRPRTLARDAMRLSATLVAAVALVSAVALGLAGR